MLPAQPIKDYLRGLFPYDPRAGGWTHNNIHGIDAAGAAKHLGYTRRHIQRLFSADEISVSVADHFCCRMGMHPWEIYGDDWLEL